MVSKQNNKYDLDILERINLLGLLPEKGNLITVRIVAELRNDIGFNEKELSDWKIKTEGGQITWDVSKVKTKEIIIGPSSIGVLKERVEELDKMGEITEQILPLIEKLGL